MKILLDSHVFIWMVAEPDRINKRTKQLIRKSTLFLSPISAYEINHKISLGKLDFEFDFDLFLNEGHVVALPLTFEHTKITSELPLIHRDPFDRLLIAQSMVENIPLLTGDKWIQQYDFDFISI